MPVTVHTDTASRALVAVTAPDVHEMITCPRVKPQWWHCEDLQWGHVTEQQREGEALPCGAEVTWGHREENGSRATGPTQPVLSLSGKWVTVNKCMSHMLTHIMDDR